MKMFRFVILFPLLLCLGGCAGFVEKVLDIPVGVLTKSYDQPLTKSDLYKVQGGVRVVVRLMRNYKQLCEDLVIDSRCIAVVARLQGYSRKSRPMIQSFRRFVKNNDQVNARVVYDELRALIADFRGEAAAAGIQLPVTQ